MKKASKLAELIKKLPEWGKAIGPMAGTLLTLVSLYLVYTEKYNAFVIVVLPIILITIVGIGIYLIFSTSPSPFSKDRELPNFSTRIRVIAVGVMLLTSVTGIRYYISKPGREAVKIALRGSSTPTLTNTPTLTSTPTITATITPIPTATPKEQGIFYLFVLDASLQMQEEFEAQTKWDAALRAVDGLLVGFEKGANYGLVAIGGSPSAGSTNPCSTDALSILPFSTKEAVGERVGQLQPGGGGSLYQAFVVAKSQFDNLPENTVRTLVYITGSEDACESEDEWENLERYFKAKGDDKLNIYSEIIIIDNGIKSQTIADHISSISTKVNAQAPQTVFQVLQSNNTVITNVNNYISITINSIPTNTPTITFTPTKTATLRPGETFIAPPPNTLTYTPTFTATFTKTLTPSITPSPQPVCQSASPGLNTGSFGGSAWISSPTDCTTGIPSGEAILASGGYDLPPNTIIWVFVYPPNGPFYPQSPNACAGSPSPYPSQGGGGWSVPVYFGNPGDSSRPFDLVVMVTDQAGSDYIGHRLYEDCSSGFFDGISAGDLASLNITTKAVLTVQTQ